MSALEAIENSNNLPVDLQSKLNLARIIGRCSLPGVGEQGANRGNVITIGDVEDVDDRVQIYALTESNFARDSQIIEHSPRSQACISPQIAVKRQERAIEIGDARLLENTRRREL